MVSKARHIANLVKDNARSESIGEASIKIGGDLLTANAAADKIGIGEANPQATLDIDGDLRVGTDLEDNTGRVFKVYQANGSIAWGE